MRWILKPREPIGRLRFPYTYVLEQPKHLSYPASPTYKEVRRLAHDVREWCRQEFGPVWNGSRDDWRWSYTATDFSFRYEQDAFMFKMRWG